MPTPFSHLWIANRLLEDEAVPAPIRAQLEAQMPAFLLGSVVADARVAGGDRADTHFYRYDQPMPTNPWRVMLANYPVLKTAKSATHQAFLAGYVAHLGADEYWSRHMLKPNFADGDWGQGQRWRFFVLHLMLIQMDERDEMRLPAHNPETLRLCQPDDWLPFMPDETICEWRDFIAEQIDGDSQTLSIFGARVRRTPAELRALVDDADTMQDYLWQHISHAHLASIEAATYAFAREQLLLYLAECAG